jgi:uncharacterized protein YbbC (DUF1343 family)/CubicO group peptidase (beta-lactamase class C family)
MVAIFMTLLNLLVIWSFIWNCQPITAGQEDLASLSSGAKATRDSESSWVTRLAEAPRSTVINPSEVGIDPERLAHLEPIVQEAIKRNQIPGAVILVLRQGKICYRKSFGFRSREPTATPMTVDALFDLASLTKPIATATSLMILLEQGKLRLADRVAEYLPEFGQNGKDPITIAQLLLHTSGLMADNALEDYQEGPKKALERIYQLNPQSPPDSRFTYSDVGYIVLGQLVEKVSDHRLDDFARRHIFGPLGMRDTSFKPAGQSIERAAPTEQRDGHWMQGEVHDPRAFLLGGVAGHAGLFSTADDLAVYAQMLLNQGEFRGRRILSPATVRLMITPRRVPNGWRALGWDVQTAFSSNRGELFAFGSFGHTGFTGTSIWIDPSSQTAVIFLSNRVHPQAKSNINRLRGQVATLAAASIVRAPYPKARSETPEVSQDFGTLQRNERRNVQNGIDVLKRENYRALQGRHVGLVTNHTGVDRQGNRTIDLLQQAPEVKLVAIFSPEHGIAGQVETAVADTKDGKTELPIYSLFGKRQRPTVEQLRNIDTLVYDIQDVGCRFYTYLTTLGYILETAAEHRLKVVVLDRPNPIGGEAIEGPVLDRKLESFTAYHSIPVRHGMTVGELAGLFNRERSINADLEVIRMEGWRRPLLFDQTGLIWINPSPNMRNLTAALLYPGIGLLETTNLSVGRGTDRPFEIIGAPWLDGRRLAEALAEVPMEKLSKSQNTSALLKSVRFVPTRFTPTSSIYAGQECGGLQIFIDDWSSFSSVSTGLTIACELHRLYPKDWKAAGYQRLLAHPTTYQALMRGESPEQIRRAQQTELEEFLGIKKKYLLY